jgi:hypothetical protein
MLQNLAGKPFDFSYGRTRPPQWFPGNRGSFNSTEQG